MCFIKLDDFNSAYMDCSAVLSVEPNNAKALFRRAKSILLSDLTIPEEEGITSENRLKMAQDDLLKASKADPEDKTITAELKKVKAKREKYKNKEKGIYKNMFGS